MPECRTMTIRNFIIVRVATSLEQFWPPLLTVPSHFLPILYVCFNIVQPSKIRSSNNSLPYRLILEKSLKWSVIFHPCYIHCSVEPSGHLLQEARSSGSGKRKPEGRSRVKLEACSDKHEITESWKQEAVGRNN